MNDQKFLARPYPRDVFDPRDGLIVLLRPIIIIDYRSQQTDEWFQPASPRFGHKAANALAATMARLTNKLWII